MALSHMLFRGAAVVSGHPAGGLLYVHAARQCACTR